MSDAQNPKPGHGPEDLVLPHPRQHSLGRLRYLSAAILSLPAMAGARALPPLDSVHQSHVFLAYPDYTPTQADIDRALSRYCTDAVSCKAPKATADTTPATSSVRPQTAERPNAAPAIAAKRRTPSAKRRAAAEQSPVFIAYTAEDTPNAASAPDTLAIKPSAPKATRQQTAARPRVVTARRVTHAQKISAMAAAEHPIAETTHRQTTHRPPVVTACPVIDLPETSRVPETIALKPLPKATRRSSATSPHVAVTQRVNHSPKTSSVTRVKHSASKKTPRPATEQPNVALAYHTSAGSEASSATQPAEVCKTCGKVAAENQHQELAFVDQPIAANHSAAGYRGQTERAGRAFGGPSANDAFAAADAGPQQLMMPPPTPAPQAMNSLHSYRYVPGQKTVDDVPRPPAQQELIQLNQEGNYAALAKKGGALLKKEKVDDELKFIIANAMAWTGKLNSAETLYKTLLNGPMALDTKVALANIQRWRGKNHLAIPMYREVLALDPTHEEASRGLKLSEEALRPRTQLSVNRTHDSDDVDTSLVTLTHQWQTHDGLRSWGVEVNRMNASSPITDARQATVVVRHQALDIAMEPAVELAVGDRLYGRVTIRPTPLPVHVTVGKVNWGQMSLNPIALEKRLSAVDLGVNASFDGRFGNVSVAADNFHVSDSNNVQTGTLRFSPAIRLPLHIRPVLGLEYRKSDFNTTSYWSPDVGYGTGYVGLEGDWSGKSDRWTVSASAQRGWGFYGEARPSWGGTLSGRYKISRDWTLGASAWSIINSRDNKPYQAHSGIIFLERAW